MSTLPNVSIIVPVRNEAAFIELNLKSIFNQSYPSEKIEILVVDGISDDGTAETIRALTKTHSQIRFFENIKRIAASAFNMGIREARSDILMILSGHTKIATNYISEAVRVLGEHPEVLGVGGPPLLLGRTPFGAAAAVSMAHPFGIGSA